MRVFVDRVQKLDVREGLDVEICHKENRNEEIWRKAVIECIPFRLSDLRQFGVRLLAEDTVTPLIELPGNVSVRPAPLRHLLDRIEIKEGCHVDACHRDEWLSGFFLKEIEDDKCLVLFKSPPDIVKFEIKNVRPRMDWEMRKYWVASRFKLKLEMESIFSCGATVEARYKIDEKEAVWVPAMIVEEIKEEDNNEEEKKYIVKFCSDMKLNCKVNKPNITVGSQSVRPTQPPHSSDDEYKLLELVEVFLGSMWRKGIVNHVISKILYRVNLDATKKSYIFDSRKMRRVMEWKDGIWKIDESMLGSSMNGNASSSKGSTSPETTIPVKQTEEDKVQEQESAKKSFEPMSNQKDDFGNDSNIEESNNRKRKRDQNLTYVFDVEETKGKDRTMDLPFEKTLPIWKTFESMEVFKKMPQSPHFRPLLGTREDTRETAAVGMMLTFSKLLEEIKDLRLINPVSTLVRISDSFEELERHGFDVSVPRPRVTELFSLKLREAVKLEYLEGLEKESKKILEMQRKKKEEKDNEISEINADIETIHQELGVLEIQFQTTASAPW